MEIKNSIHHKKTSRSFERIQKTKLLTILKLKLILIKNMLNNIEHVILLLSEF